MLLAVLLSVRLVNLWYDVIDNDESTFILIASNLLDGHLPYTEMYDMKPPGFFLVLAGVMGIFGESLPVVRHFGTFALLVAAVASYAIAVRHTTPLIAGLSVAAVFTLSGVTHFQPTLTEHGVILWLMPALWLLVARRGVLWAVFGVGVLVSAATLTKTNVAYVALALGGYYAWRTWRGWRGAAGGSKWEALAYGAGGALPLAVVVAVYWAAGALDEFVLFNVTLPLTYAYGQTGAPDAFIGFVSDLSNHINNVYAFAVTLFIAAGLAFALLGGKKSLWKDAAPLLLVFVALALSILQSGQGHIHYLLQLLPLAAVFTAFGFGVLRARLAGKAAWVGVAPAMVALVAGLLHYGNASAHHLVNRWDALGNTPLKQAAELIRNDDETRPVFAPQQTLIYWYLDQPPPSKMVHPSGLGGQGIVQLIERGYLPKKEHQRVIAADYGYWVMLPDSAVWDYYHPTFREWAFGARDTRFDLWQQVAAPDARFAMFNGDVAERFSSRRDLPGFDIYKRR